MRGGGGHGLGYDGGASGSVLGCHVHDFRRGSGIFLVGRGSSPYVAHTRIERCLRGIWLFKVGGAWRLGEGNAFEENANGDVADERIPNPVSPLLAAGELEGPGRPPHQISVQHMVPVPAAQPTSALEDDMQC